MSTTFTDIINENFQKKENLKIALKIGILALNDFKDEMKKIVDQELIKLEDYFKGRKHDFEIQ